MVALFIIMQIYAFNQSSGTIDATIKVCAPDEKYLGCTYLMMQGFNREEVAQE